MNALLPYNHLHDLKMNALLPYSHAFKTLPLIYLPRLTIDKI